ncbi:zinc-dependent alcohol dehydrogenase family protein [Vibrio ishigakensis]|uniref:zinc-dependent alcohol dehydrogenase family protein n=1 Tax=Vibrio ishigakensis TaxID=1481914 RepID=UPI0021C46390|nr:zinc-dependent alcohol dehydrogenase family protein [Vibrio ishigakensis]
MKAMVVKEFGGSDAFVLDDIPKPEVSAGNVLVKIVATSVNTVDMMIREMGPGLPFSPPAPAVLGMDFAGVVEAVGDGVNDYQVGDEVYGCAGGLGDLQGTLAEYMVADARLIARKPKNLSMQQAAAIPLVGITAYEGLDRAGLRPGHKILIHGGAGGVGHIAIQLAKHFGADVYATGSSDKQIKLIEELGAIGINYNTESVADYVEKYTGGIGFDVVYDSVGGANLPNSIEATKLNGQIATTVSLLELDLSMVHLKGLSLHVVFMLIPMIHNVNREQHSGILKAMSHIAEEGFLTPIVDPQVFPLEEVGKAHDHLASRTAIGKVIVEI